MRTAVTMHRVGAAALLIGAVVFLPAGPAAADHDAGDEVLPCEETPTEPDETATDDTPAEGEVLEVCSGGGGYAGSPESGGPAIPGGVADDDDVIGQPEPVPPPPVDETCGGGSGGQQPGAGARAPDFDSDTADPDTGGADEAGEGLPSIGSSSVASAGISPALLCAAPVGDVGDVADAALPNRIDAGAGGLATTATSTGTAPLVSALLLFEVLRRRRRH